MPAAAALNAERASLRRLTAAGSARSTSRMVGRASLIDRRSRSARRNRACAPPRRHPAGGRRALVLRLDRSTAGRPSGPRATPPSEVGGVGAQAGHVHRPRGNAELRSIRLAPSRVRMAARCRGNDGCSVCMERTPRRSMCGSLRAGKGGAEAAKAVGRPERFRVVVDLERRGVRGDGHPLDLRSREDVHVWRDRPRIVERSATNEAHLGRAVLAEDGDLTVRQRKTRCAPPSSRGASIGFGVPVRTSRRCASMSRLTTNALAVWR